MQYRGEILPVVEFVDLLDERRKTRRSAEEGYIPRKRPENEFPPWS